MDFGKTLTNRFSRAFHGLRIYLCSDWSFSHNLSSTVRWPCCFLLPCYVKKNIAVEMTSSSCHKSFVSFFIHLFWNDIEKYFWPLTDCKCLLCYFPLYFVFLSNVVSNLLSLIWEESMPAVYHYLWIECDDIFVKFFLKKSEKIPCPCEETTCICSRNSAYIILSCRSRRHSFASESIEVLIDPKW